MSRRDPNLALRQMLAHAREAVDLIRGKTRLDLDRDRLLNLALTRLVEIIGEAANRVPEDIRTQYPDLPWVQMIGARNRLIHGYDHVDFDILWMIVDRDLPELINQLEKIFSEK
jgi:uncharacterized protein with HEPN domain